MKIPFTNIKKNPVTLEVTVQAPKKTLIGIIVCDAKHKDTIYSQSYTNVEGVVPIEIRLPQVPQYGYVIVYNASDKNNKDSGFRVLKTETKKLKTDITVYDSTNPILQDFVKFAQDFSERASYLPTKNGSKDRSIYTSNDGKFTIHYLDEIMVNGKPRPSSMRVNQKTGVMELAKKYVSQYTVAERMAILLHEFSHFYLNKNHKDEFEADMNALMVYCGLGYPRKEAGTAWYKVFYRTPSDMNIDRMQKIYTFLRNFDRTNFNKKAA